eukprot:CAMPEP_0172036618 /NCGR_PEP_ID=MMETSP1041-20130122/22267_1 /TAXON_ID=464988 /ORGANISM="Hemiselmis andersenii, Strain CCMP439" /LENGTH=34 /DNA_ID= /DNA_START= /DNA_END= /DNA_ORIENTATION=
MRAEAETASNPAAEMMLADTASRLLSATASSTQL